MTRHPSLRSAARLAARLPAALLRSAPLPSVLLSSVLLLAALSLAGLPLTAHPLSAQADNMSFFLTSAGPGNGADLGGLAGADAHCSVLAEGQGAGDRVWRAYLSAAATGTGPAVHARDRIGSGPWYNHAGVLVARDVTHLHSVDANLTKATILTERGEPVNGRGDSPNRHDILTGSTLDGRAFSPDDGDTTCSNWTSSGEGSARVGHHDRTGGGEHPESWNSAHPSRGCSQENLRGTGGDGLFYCFAADAGGSAPSPAPSPLPRRR
ncbi:MAG: hypothetical protein RQ751_02235 [Longimicrobiales bacterium]|nr:hypothetical protein [Longimicrobiales bacterium]